MVKNLLANVGDKRDAGSITGLRKAPGAGHGNPLQYPCLENPMNRGAWQATVHRVGNSWTQLKQLAHVHTHVLTHTHTHTLILSSLELVTHFSY